MNFLSSTINYKCPRCREGDLFTKPFNLAKPLDMPKRCAVCDQRTEPEPGFYFGAMFLSYLLTSFPMLALGLGAAFMLDWTMGAVIGLLLFIGAISFLKVLRFSRSLWIHIMVKYDPNVEKKKLPNLS